MAKARIKAEIAHVGLIVPVDTQTYKDKINIWLPGEMRAQTERIVTLWEFNCMGLVPLLEVRDDGDFFLAGYSVDELQQISREHYGGIKGYG